MKLESDHRIYELRSSELWGPPFWDFLYLTALGFPVTLSATQQSEFARLLKTFHLFLPCAECRFHYSKMIKDINTDVKTRDEAFTIVRNIHNKIRKRLKKNVEFLVFTILKIRLH